MLPSLLLLACRGNIAEVPTPPPTPEPVDWERQCSQSFVPPPLEVDADTPILDPPERMAFDCGFPMHIVPHPDRAEHFLIWSDDVGDMVEAACPRTAAVFDCEAFTLYPGDYDTWDVDELAILPWGDDGSGVGERARVRLDSFWTYERGGDLQGEQQGGLIATRSFPPESGMALEVEPLLRPGVPVRWVGQAPLASTTRAHAASGGQVWEMDPFGNGAAGGGEHDDSIVSANVRSR